MHAIPSQKICVIQRWMALMLFVLATLVFALEMGVIDISSFIKSPCKNCSIDLTKHTWTIRLTGLTFLLFSCSVLLQSLNVKGRLSDSLSMVAWLSFSGLLIHYGFFSEKMSAFKIILGVFGVINFLFLIVLIRLKSKDRRE